MTANVKEHDDSRENISFSFVLIGVTNKPFEVPYFPAQKTHRPIRRTVIFSLDILEKKWWTRFNFSNLLEENRIVTYQN